MKGRMKGKVNTSQLTSQELLATAVAHTHNFDKSLIGDLKLKNINKQNEKSRVKRFALNSI